jgi:magnesium transporter
MVSKGDTNRTVWLSRDTSSRIDIEAAATEFESTSGATLHWIARHHLVDGSGIADDPFPRIEEHPGYLFGILYVPSNPGDILAEFDEVAFVATHDSVFGTYSRRERSVLDWPSLLDRHSTPTVFGPGDDHGGITLVRMLKTIVKQLKADAEYFDEANSAVAHDLGIDLEHGSLQLASDRLRSLSRRQRHELQQAADQRRVVIARQRNETTLMRRVIVETEGILERLASDQLDLSTDTRGNTRQLFTRNLEIFVADAYIDARHVSSLMTVIDDRLAVIHDYMKQLKDDENVAANRFTGAIASIMLVPTFIVGLYGQNFVNLPETSWRFGYLFSWGVIAVVTIGQVWYFKRRRWI